MLSVNRVALLQHEELGPGRRIGLWVNGCPFNCEGCTAPELIPIRQGAIDEDKLARYMLDYDWDGLTISGGEPFSQSATLSRLVFLLKQARPDINVLVYSGYTLKQLKQKPQCHGLLASIDALVDGLYQQQKHRNFFWLGGSANQRLHLLSDRVINWHRDIAALIESINQSVNHPLVKRRGNDHAIRIELDQVWLASLPPATAAQIQSCLVRVSTDFKTGEWAGIPPKAFGARWNALLEARGLVIKPLTFNIE